MQLLAVSWSRDHGCSDAGDGFTPIHRACWGGEKRHTDTVRAFLEAGVPHDEPASNGQTPVQLVRGNPATQKLLKQWAKKGKKADEPDEL